MNRSPVAAVCERWARHRQGSRRGFCPSVANSVRARKRDRNRRVPAVARRAGSSAGGQLADPRFALGVRCDPLHLGGGITGDRIRFRPAAAGPLPRRCCPRCFCRVRVGGRAWRRVRCGAVSAVERQRQRGGLSRRRLRRLLAADRAGHGQALAWRLNAHAQWQLGARRRVGQLDFADFAASASLGDATVVAGNPDLGPDQATRYFTSFDYRAMQDRRRTSRSSTGTERMCGADPASLRCCGSGPCGRGDLPRCQGLADLAAACAAAAGAPRA